MAATLLATGPSERKFIDTKALEDDLSSAQTGFDLWKSNALTSMDIVKDKHRQLVTEEKGS